MKKILIIGAEPKMVISFHLALIRHLVSRGNRVYVAATGISSEPDVLSRLLNVGALPRDFRLSRNGLNIIDDLISMTDLVRLIAEVRPDVVLAYTAKPVVYGILASAIMRVRRRCALITGLGYAFTRRKTQEKSFVGVILPKLYKISLSYASIVVFQNPDDMRDFREIGVIGEAANDAVIDGCGIDTQAYKAEPLPAGCFTFVMVARLISDKGVREYVQACERLKESGFVARFLLVGGLDTNPGAISKAEVDSWIDRGVVDVVGAVSDVRPYLSSSHVFVLPSYREGLPQSTLEALAMGRPILTTDVPGCRETVVDGSNGYLIPERDVDALEAAMIRMMSPDCPLQQFADASRAMAVGRFDAERVNQAMERHLGLA